jgi:hypothetical protein
MVLFPIALVWLAIALWWIIKNSSNEPDVEEPTWRRFVPRIPQRPWNGAPGDRRRAKVGSRRD